MGAGGGGVRLGKRAGVKKGTLRVTGGTKKRPPIGIRLGRKKVTVKKGQRGFAALTRNLTRVRALQKRATALRMQLKLARKAATKKRTKKGR